MDIAAWLDGLGLGQYAQAFRDNEIDGRILASLTTEDLKDLGVLLVGHRRRLLDAIAALGTSIPVAAATGHTEGVAPRSDAERRQLTVMFCDLVGSTALASRLDPEDLREVIGAYHRCVAETIGRYEGFVAKYMGDGVLAYFGYPQAHEDDAERAIRASLATVEEVRRVASPEALQVRIGLATGLAVVGDLLGSGAAQEQAVIGETPNLAARLQAVAGPDEIVIPENTRRLVGNLFEYENLGEIEVKGLPASVPAFRVLGERQIGSRFEALRNGETPLIGRDEELELLRRRWAQAKAGRGQVVLISAEPGIGKSRLAEAFRQGLEGEPHTRLRYFCSPYHQDSALFPFIAQLERAAGFEREDTQSARLDKLQALVASSEPAEGDVHLLAELLSLAVHTRYPALDLTPQRKKEKTFEALLRQLAALARPHPVLMIIEDLHWADPSSRELLDLTVDQVERLSVLLIATFRPEYQPSWTGQPHVTTVSLRRLAQAESDELVRGLVGNSVALSNEMVAEIVERTDGVPLFLEELTTAVLEAYGDTDPNRAAAAVPATALAVPATLHASLMARLDRLGRTAKEIAQVGAAIGRDFSYELLAAVARQGEADLQAGLSRLVDANLLLQRGMPPRSVYLFKHALVQDTAYSTLLRAPRRLLHARIADALLTLTVDGPAAAPEIIAHHLQNAGRPIEAIKYWQEAGEQAVRGAANREAVEHLRRALFLLDRTPASGERWRAELAVLTQLTPALMNVHGWSATEVGQSLERAAEVGRRLPSSADLAPSIVNLYLFNIVRGRLDRCDEISADLFRMGRELEDPEIVLQAHHCAFATRYFRGLFREAGEHVAGVLTLYEEDRHAHHRYVYMGHDPAVCGLALGVLIQWMLGNWAQAVQFEKDAAALGNRLQHAPSLTRALWHICDAQTARGDIAAAISTANNLRRLSEDNRLLQPHANALIFLGWALACSAQVTEGISLLEQGLDALRRTGDLFYMPRSLCLMAEGYLAARRLTDGLEQLARALDIAAEIGAAWYLPRLYWVRADLLLHAHGPEDEAVEASLRKSLAVAQQQGARGWELAAATRLARFWQGRGRIHQARDLLAPVHDWFTEGFDTPDLKEAKALLDELR